MRIIKSISQEMMLKKTKNFPVCLMLKKKQGQKSRPAAALPFPMFSSLNALTRCSSPFPLPIWSAAHQLQDYVQSGFWMWNSRSFLWEDLCAQYKLGYMTGPEKPSIQGTPWVLVLNGHHRFPFSCCFLRSTETLGTKGWNVHPSG